MQEAAAALSTDPHNRHAPGNIYARAVLYGLTPNSFKNVLFNDMRQVSLLASYHPDLVAKVFTMTHDFVTGWKDISCRTPTWDTKDPVERWAQYATSYATYDLNCKKNVFENVYPTQIVDIDDYFMTAQRNDLEKIDVIGISAKALDLPEIYAVSAAVHEKAHLLVADFQKQEKAVYGETIRKVCTDLLPNGMLKDVSRDGMKYVTKWAETVHTLAENIQNVFDPKTMSTATMCTYAFKTIENYDELFSGYNRSPEEALVRAAQTYAAFLFDADHAYAKQVKTAVLKDNVADSYYMNAAATKHFFAHAQQHEAGKYLMQKVLA